MQGKGCGRQIINTFMIDRGRFTPVGNMSLSMFLY